MKRERKNAQEPRSPRSWPKDIRTAEVQVNRSRRLRVCRHEAHGQKEEYDGTHVCGRGVFLGVKVGGDRRGFSVLEQNCLFRAIIESLVPPRRYCPVKSSIRLICHHHRTSYFGQTVVQASSDSFTLGQPRVRFCHPTWILRARSLNFISFQLKCAHLLHNGQFSGATCGLPTPKRPPHEISEKYGVFDTGGGGVALYGIGYGATHPCL